MHHVAIHEDKDEPLRMIENSDRFLEEDQSQNVMFPQTNDDDSDDCYERDGDNE